MNTRAKEIQQVNPSWAWQQPKHQAPTISSIDKSLSRNRHKVWSLTHWHAIKEESKVYNRDWVDHQACSLLQYINVIANLFIMGNYFNELRWKIIRANNLLQFIHQITIEFRFRKSLAQERFKSNLEFRYQNCSKSSIPCRMQGSLYCKQYGPRNDLSQGAGFIVFAKMYHDKI